VSGPPLKLCIAVPDGRQGEVLIGWLLACAHSAGYVAHATTTAGAEPRTGATWCYLELFPKEEAERAGREPVLALMPVPGDVDCVAAGELVEAGRAIQRGLVTRDRTTLIASSHRTYTFAEKSALGQGMADADELLALLRRQAQRLVLMDMEAIAGEHRSPISAVLLGAICGAGVLPFKREVFEDAIVAGGIAVAASLPAFHAGCRSAAERGVAADQPAACGSGPAPPSLPAPLAERLGRLPAPVQPLADAGVRRLMDYQDIAYGAHYIEQLLRLSALESGGAWTLTAAVARSLALWMSYEDPIRVADLKTRAARFARVRAAAGVADGEVLAITDFMQPGLAELAALLPAGLGSRVLRQRLLLRACAGRTWRLSIRTSSVAGFLLLYALAGLRGWRRHTLRFRQETRRIEIWLARIEHLAVAHPALAVELARAQRLIKGYGETYERGMRSFTRLCAELGRLAACADGAERMARLLEAALADEEGRTLARELAAVPGAACPAALPGRLEPLP
jgi:indolepyruvate ferredoxin oxidoreductase, beta subunit